MSSRSTRSMTVEDVDSINTMPRALRVMRDLQVPMTDKDMNLDKAKAIIKEALVAGDTSRRGKRVANIADRDTTTAALKDDANNRDKLRALYTEAYEYVSKLPRPFQTDLEQMFPHYDRQLKNYQEDLQSSQCVLLVAGEMGSGKSSLVNLLLGSPLLPTSELRCTATIVEISYGPTPQAVAHFRDDSMGHGKKPLVIRCDSSQRVGNFLKDLEMLIIKRDEETDESPFEKIQFYWPLDILQGGVTIVDSPGVGDAKGLPQILADYMEKAFGFIYVIDSTTSIHKHRLGQLLLKAVEASDGFDHNTALFVCNRWDQISPSDSERVKESLADRLSMILPGVKKSQLYPISVKQSTLDMEYGQVRPEHQQLVEGIRRFLPQTMRGKLRIYYRYLSILLKRSLYSLRISYNMLKDKVQEIRKNYKGVENRISVLQGNAKKKLDEMRHEVKRASFDAGSQAMEYMASMHNRSKLVEWTDGECPKREKTWQNVFKNANLAIGERVAQQINTWESRTEFVKTVEDGIIKSFKEQFDFFDDQLREIQGVLISGDEMRNFVMETRRDAPQKRPVKAQRPKGSSDSYLSLGAAVTANFALDPKDQRIKRLFKDKYDGSPAKVMKEATLMLLTQMTEATVASAMGKFFDRFIKGIDRVGSLVPQLMKADQDLLVNLNTELRNGQQKLDAFPSMSRTCSSLQGRLDMFYVQRLMVTDFTADQLVYGPVLGKGSFASVFKATLRLKAGDVQVAIKEPHDALKGEDVTDVLLEDAMLRDVEHKNIVKYYGVCRKGPEDNLRLIFTMEYCPYTLKGKCIDVDNSPSSLGNNPLRQREAIQHMANYLIQICEGLNYLHQKAVVHRDLKPENVLLSARSEVKIADFGLAKKVSEVVTHGIGTPVYMSPEILLFSDKYDTKADVYSLAMIMWELWYGKDLAKYASTEIVGGLKMSIEREWRPTLSIVHSPPPFWVELMTRCWAQKPKLRPSAREVGNALVNFLQEIQ